jgi:hypothetical protein
MKATVEPSFIYIDSIDDDDPISGADPVGINDDVMLQSISINPNSGSLVTWITDDSGNIAYARQGASLVTTSYTTRVGKPGAWGDYVYNSRAANVFRGTVDWDQVDLDDTTPFVSNAQLGAHGGTAVATHGVSATRCVVILNDDGGLRVQVWDDTTSYSQPGRFMFPKAVDYTDLTTSGSERSGLSLATFSGAVEYDGKIYIYISNPQTGGVEGIAWDISSKVWSDIFTAVSTDLRSSLCDPSVNSESVIPFPKTEPPTSLDNSEEQKTSVQTIHTQWCSRPKMGELSHSMVSHWFHSLAIAFWQQWEQAAFLSGVATEFPPTSSRMSLTELLDRTAS